MRPVGILLSLGFAALIGSSAVLAAQQEAEPPSEQAVDEIRFRVTDLRSNKGTVVCGLFVAENWLRAGAVGASGEITDGAALCVFSNVNPGTYGISAYHDENGNRRLDSNFIRIPKEGTAASNDARGKFGPPKFKNARFDYVDGILELEGSTQYR